MGASYNGSTLVSKTSCRGSIPFAPAKQNKVELNLVFCYDAWRMKTAYTLKRDKFKHVRGGYSRLLDIYCRKCEKPILVYQKDGPGNLRRLYLDRIFAPEELVNLHLYAIKELGPFRCPHCHETLGMPYIYQKEKRKAFRLFQDAVVKRVKKSAYA